MTSPAIIDDIRAGIATTDQAREFAAECMGEGTEKSVRALYGAMRSFVWKAIHAQRGDDELHEWHEILRSIESGLSSRFEITAAQIRVLHEMIAELIAVANTRSPETVLQKRQVGTVLKLLQEQAPISQAELLERMTIGRASVMRILQIMRTAGLVEHCSRQPESMLELSAKGKLVVRSQARKS